MMQQRLSMVCLIAISCALLVVHFPALSRSQCSPTNTRWTTYVLSVAPSEFEGESTWGLCTALDGTSCIGPGFGVGGEGRLGDEDHGPDTLNVSAVQAWDRTVSITPSLSMSLTITGITLYFYNIPSRGIGLPFDIRITSGTNTNHVFALEGNLDLSQDDNGLRNVTLIPQALSSQSFTITFTFSSSDRIDWLLLTEMEICTRSPVPPLPIPPPITFTEDTVSSISPSTVNSSITLTCSVAIDGRFTWSWSGPPGVSLPSPLVLNAGRTSVLELSQLSADLNGAYTCMATHTFGQDRPSATSNITLSLEGIIREENNLISVSPSDTVATLRCMLYGYLPSGVEPSIMWRLGGTTLSNDGVYTITSEEGDMLIQNGGSQPIPSLSSTLTVNLALAPMSSIQQYSCFSSQASSPGFQTIILMRAAVPPIDPASTTPSDSNGTTTDSTSGPGTSIDASSGNTTTPVPSNQLGIILGVILSVIALLLIVIIIVTVIICVVRNRNRESMDFPNRNCGSMDYLNDYDTKDPLYQEVPQPKPPPLPAHFPSLSVSDIGPYAVVDNGLDSGHIELVTMNGFHNSIADMTNPMPLRLKTEPQFLQNNPLYASADHLDKVVDTSSLSRRRMLSSVSSLDKLSEDANGSILNIYARPSRVAPPIPDRPPTPVLMENSVYSEPLSPSMLKQKRGSTPPESTGEVFECPASSVYADPQPLLKSEGPIEVAPTQVREVRNLGTGQFGQVSLAETIGLSLKDVRLSETNNDRNIAILVAIKRLKPEADSHVKEAFEKEIKFMSRLNHKNVVRLLGICPYGSAFIIMEYMENGDLHQYLRKHSENDVLSPDALLYMAIQIASGMMYLATLKFIHRDLATRNCLVGSNNEVKIADFGMSRSLYSSYYYRIRGRAMLPIRWMANECFYGRFSEKTDVWAFGVTVWEIFTLGVKQPYDGMNDQEVINDAIKGPDRQLLEKPDLCPQDVYEVMLQCWKDDPDMRAKFSELHSMLEAIYEHTNNPSLT